MAIELLLWLDEQGGVLARCEGELLGEAVPLSGLPRLSWVKDEAGVEKEVNPFYPNPYALGERLFAALGGEALVARLDEDEEGLLCLLTDEETAKVPWEYAVTAEGEFLGCIYGMVRLLPELKPSRAAKTGSLTPLNLVILAADPLVDGQGNPYQGAKLALEREMGAIKEKLRQSEAAVVARRVPPTKKALQSALRKGPAILHLSCHGKVVGKGNSRQAVLSLEDRDGKQARLRGNHLKRLPPRGVLRLVVMSACQTAASAQDADLAQALVMAGIPAAIGMLGNFPDALSDEFAATLYESLLAGQPLSEALRQARWIMAQELPSALGLAVAYIAPDGNQPLPLQAGRAELGEMAWAHWLKLPPSLQPPRTLVGREGELHQLAQLFSQGHKVITVVGTGGMGKTALSAAFAERFGWRFGGGVIGATLADSPLLSPETFFEGLLRRLLGEQRAQQVAGQPAAQIVEQLLAQLRQQNILILLDNYESVLQALDEEPDESEGVALSFSAEARANAQRLHRLVYKLAEGGATLLLTSRRQPAGLAGEMVFPPRRTLTGINLMAGATLFIHHSKRSKQNSLIDLPLALQDSKEAKEKGLIHLLLALQVAEVTAGHPLAIALLAGEWDISEGSPDSFLQNWHQELAAAHRAGLAKHHVTFATAFERSFRHLTSQQQAQLVALSRFNAPFFAEGAASLWHGKLPAEEAELNPIRSTLNTFVRRSLLRIEGTYSGTDQAATYHLEPVIARALARHDVSNPETVERGYHAYAAWLVGRARSSIGSDPGMANLARQWLDELLLLADGQPEQEIARYNSRLAYLLRHFGRVKEGLALLEQGRPYADESTLSSIAYEQANMQVLMGNLKQALIYYQESLVINEKIGDLQGKAVTLHQMAQIYLTRGQLDKAERLLKDSLAIHDKIGDLQSKAATLHQMAQIYLIRGQLDKAEGLLKDSLALKEKIGDLQGKAATLSMMANIKWQKEQWPEAEQLVYESLQIAKDLPDEKAIAFNLMKLGQLAEVQGDIAKAAHFYEQALERFEKLEMSKANKVRQMLASLGQSQAAPAPERSPEELLIVLTQAAQRTLQGQHKPAELAGAITGLLQQGNWQAEYVAYLEALAQAVQTPQDALDGLVLPASLLLGKLEPPLAIALATTLARLFEQQQHPAAIAFQEGAIALCRSQGSQPATQQQLSVLLYNHAGYLAKGNRLDDAINALAEVVAIDERLGLPDLESDRAALEQMKQWRGW